jgi:hypothetical protein
MPFIAPPFSWEGCDGAGGVARWKSMRAAICRQALGYRSDPCWARWMEHVALLVLLIAIVAVGIIVAMRRSSKNDPVEENPMRGTTRRSKQP